MQVYAIGGRCGRRFEPRLGRRIVSFGHRTKLARKSAYSPFGCPSHERLSDGLGPAPNHPAVKLAESYMSIRLTFGYRADFPGRQTMDALVTTNIGLAAAPISRSPNRCGRSRRPDAESGA